MGIFGFLKKKNKGDMAAAGATKNAAPMMTETAPAAPKTPAKAAAPKAPAKATKAPAKKAPAKKGGSKKK